ncbi:MAG TPA: winged helix-turn-helix domain-containing protein [Syntrophobacteria bacterium]|nr:winged helix-turn-helix domain-containing protein [Syntrophobacteria bacterium]
MTSNEKTNKDRLKSLREERRHLIQGAAARMKEQKKAIQAIQEKLSAGPQTVPEIAQGIGLPASKVLWFVAAMKKYGQIMEGEKDGSYFRYGLAERAGAEGSH